MRLLFGSHLTVSMKGQAGGIRTYIMTLKSTLESLGHCVKLWDCWSPIDLQEYDLIHLFPANLATHRLGQTVKRGGNKLVISPSLDRAISPTIIRLANFGVRNIPKIHTNLSAAQDLCELADLVIVWSEHERDYLVRAFGLPQKKLVVVPYGLDLQSYQSSDPQLFINKYSAEKFILTVGNLGGSRKNYLRLIKAVGVLDIPAFFIGPIPDNSYAEACRYEAQKYGNIHLLGFVPREMLLSAYAAADTYVQPSITEGVGISALEAGLLGAKLVVSQNGAPPYYFGKFAEYVDPKSVPSIREKLLIAFKTPKTTELQQHIRKYFTQDNVKYNLVNAYERML